MLDSPNETAPLPTDLNNKITEDTIREEEDNSIPGLGFPYNTDLDEEDEPYMYPIDSNDSDTVSAAQESTLSDPGQTLSPSNPDREAISTTQTPITCDTPTAEDQGTTPHVTGRCTQSGVLIPSQIIHMNAHILQEATPQQADERTPHDDTHDNYYIGDVLSLPKAPNTTRLYFQNVNGISLCTPGTWMDTCEHFRDLQVDIALIAKHKLDTSQSRVIKRLHDNPKKLFELGSYSINATSTPVKAQSMYKPGGVLSFTSGGIKGRILEAGTDPWGRWVFTNWRNIGPPITVIATYQVVDCNPRRSGPTTYTTQLYATYIGK